MKRFITLNIIIFVIITTNIKAQELTILTHQWAPYNFKEQDIITGISTELVESALHMTGFKYKLQLYPFKRALYTAQTTPNTMFFTVARIPQLETKFKWIGPLHPRVVYLYRLKKRTDIQISSIEDIKKYQTGALLGGSVEQFFKTNGFQEKEDYFLTATSEQLLKLLAKGRADLIPGDPLDLAYQMQNSEYNFSDLEQAFLLSDIGGYYIAVNQETADEVVAKIQTALDKIINAGSREVIINKYLRDQ
ncbi:ABC transporter substrate-binding protein [Catenovulum sp. 2E275]|uniref:substrate-binding periplasmic protein n=1 Tax=Catenovulum sp. 2E275 TaxID=2980497 RepID=UPI0021CF7E24|nr:ABC transporter substrate-binding protein [Catenovulum sp. 2E275]MCU4674143.1 ABC transporter substrate-binding protein [Catenovulum sp. 2E275]